ncbi:hypothetical protein PoB_001876200 [Plakobranchus ocellatus]|uniref:DDE-1 domain-containing protein n=1 Tax=Plakobranchus ocellatus TaxID=259542 RepID=A0AAV3ZCL5_9GAST|nr:hypothetical protein PoB_001876200 [Plakobranchus ocellatus]
MQKFISSFNETGSTDTHLRMSLLDASMMAAASWNEVTPATIQNCYRHAGFVQKNSGKLIEREELPVPLTVDESASGVSNLFEKSARMTDFFLEFLFKATVHQCG